MKIKIIIALVGLVIVSTAILVHGWRQDSVEQWDMIARETFKEALRKDLQSRDNIKIEFYGEQKLVSLRTRIPQSVFIISERGRREYKIDSCKYVHNITSDSQNQSIASVVLEEHPLKSDTVNRLWKVLLDRKKIVARTKVRISVTDLDNNITSESSELWDPLAVTDSLCSCYVGCRCEVEITSFINYAWLENMEFKDYLIFSCPILIVMFLYVIWYILEDKIKKIFVKEVPIIPVEGKVLPICKLGDGLYFDFEESLLRKNDKCEHLSPQSKLLLKAFIEAKDNCLSTESIMALLWPNNNGTSDKVHQSVTRLRGVLARISQITLSNENYTYRLKFPHFTEKK